MDDSDVRKLSASGRYRVDSLGLFIVVNGCGVKWFELKEPTITTGKRGYRWRRIGIFPNVLVSEAIQAANQHRVRSALFRQVAVANSLIDRSKRVTSAAQLYRHFSKEGDLLYVGISCNHVSRLADHRVESTWFPLISSITVEHFATRQAAEAAEKSAIANERPIFNRMHNTSAVLRLASGGSADDVDRFEAQEPTP